MAAIMLTLVSWSRMKSTIGLLQDVKDFFIGYLKMIDIFAIVENYRPAK